MSKQLGFMRVEMFCQSSSGLLWSLVIFTMFSVLLSSCDAQTSPAKDEAERVKTDISADEPTAIQMSNGSSLVLPPGSAPEGSEVRLQSTSELPVFDSLSSSEITPGSLAINVSVYNSSGERLSELEQPMLVGLPIQSTSLLLVEKSEANLCAFLSALDKSLQVWRAAKIKVVDNKAQFLTTKLGKFQLAYCGDAPLSGFTEVEDEKLASVEAWEVEHNIDSTTGTAKVKDLELSYEIPASYSSGASSLCAFMLSAQKKTETGSEDELEPVAMLASGVYTVKSGAATLIKLPFASANLDHDGVILGVAMLATGKSCSWTSIVDVDVLFESQDEYLSFHIFYLGNDEVKEQNIGSMGTGSRAYGSMTLAMGYDDDIWQAAATSLLTDFPKGVHSCVVTGSHADDSFWSSSSYNIILDPLKIDGQTSAKYFFSTPSTIKVNSQIEVYVGITCIELEKGTERATFPGEKAQSYFISFENVSKDSTYRLVPSLLGIVEATASPSRCLEMTQSTATARYKLATNSISATNTPSPVNVFLPSIVTDGAQATYSGDLYAGCSIDGVTGTKLGTKNATTNSANPVYIALDF